MQKPETRRSVNGNAERDAERAGRVRGIAEKEAPAERTRDAEREPKERRR